MSATPRNARKTGTRRKTLLQLEPHDCRWPIGEPRHPDFHFCGEQCIDGRPYCGLHWSIAFQPARPRHGSHQAPAAAPSETPKAA
jgi:GcrA cell cycle regulator